METPVAVIVKTYFREQMNLWRIGNKWLFFLKAIAIVIGALLLGFIVNPSQLFTPAEIVLFIVLQAIVISWLQTVLNIYQKLFSLNDMTFPFLAGIHKSSIILAISLINAVKNTIIALGICLYFSTAHLALTLLYFVVFFISSFLSFLLAILFALFSTKFIKSVTWLVLFVFVIQIVLLFSLLGVAFTKISVMTVPLVIYFLIALFALFFICVKPNVMDRFYMISVDSFNKINKTYNKGKERVSFVKMIKSPIVFKDAILLFVNPITKIRFYVWIIAQVAILFMIEKKGLPFLIDYLPLSQSHEEWFVFQISIITPFLFFGEIVISSFYLDKGVFKWYILTGIKGRKLFFLKATLGFCILLAPSLLIITVYVLFLNLSITSFVSIVTITFFSLLSLVITTLSISLFDVNIEVYSKPSEPSVITEQIPQTNITYLSLLVGFLLLFIFYKYMFISPSLGVTDFITAIACNFLSVIIYSLSMNRFENKVIRYRKGGNDV
ncbi:hypothetical protein P4S75_13525 [Anoxybacillus ayderensis]|uniref:hypothetical protein n=1 Tax=Anoxybacillus ayderensis TaxID=265546 RepID=UPI002E1E2E1C|nr:hypothetical protein [Anoxybacillus ayderensis]